MLLHTHTKEEEFITNFFFSSTSIADLDGSSYPPIGWVNGHWVQLGNQLAGICAIFGYSFTLSCIILFLMNLVPGLSLRVNAEDEDVGVDDCQLGEFAYDYVEMRRHVLDAEMLSSPAVMSSSSSTAEKHSAEKMPMGMV